MPAVWQVTDVREVTSVQVAGTAIRKNGARFLSAGFWWTLKRGLTFEAEDRPFKAWNRTASRGDR